MILRIFLDIILFVFVLVVLKLPDVYLAVNLGFVVLLSIFDAVYFFTKANLAKIIRTKIIRTLDFFRFLLLFYLGGLIISRDYFGLDGIQWIVTRSIWALFSSLLTGYFLVKGLTFSAVKQSANFSVSNLLKLLLATLFVYFSWAFLSAIESFH